MTLVKLPPFHKKVVEIASGEVVLPTGDVLEAVLTHAKKQRYGRVNESSFS